MTRRRFDDAVGALRGRPITPTRVEACRRAVRRPALAAVADEQGKPGLVEMSSHNIKEAQTSAPAVPDARFVHTVRDGRDVASSVTTKTWGPDRHRAGRSTGGPSGCARSTPACAARRTAPPTRWRRQPAWSSSTTWSSAIARRPTSDFSTSAASADDPAMRALLRRGDEPGSRAPGPLARRARRRSAGWRGASARYGARSRRSRARATTPRRAAASDGGRRAPWLNRILFVTSNGTGLGHLTRSMAIARRLEAACEPLVFTLSAAAPVVRELGFPGRVRGLLPHARRRQRLALVAPPAGPRLRAAIAEADPARRGLRRRPPLPGAARRAARRARRPLGLVPAGDVEARRQPGALPRAAVLRRGARAGRARRRGRSRTDGRPPRRRPRGGADRLLRRRRAPAASRGRARARTRAGPGPTSWCSSARARRSRARRSAAFATWPAATGGPGGGALLQPADRGAFSTVARADVVAPAGSTYPDEPLLRRLRRRGVGRRLQRLPRADPLRGPDALRADAARDRRPGRPRALRSGGRARAARSSGPRRPSSSASSTRCSTPSGAAAIASTLAAAPPADGAARPPTGWASWRVQGRAPGAPARGAGNWHPPGALAAQGGPRFLARVPPWRRGARRSRSIVSPRPPRTVVLALGIDGRPSSRASGRRSAARPIRPSGCWWSPTRSTSRRCGARAWASSTSRPPARRSRSWPAATTIRSCAGAWR